VNSQVKYILTDDPGQIDALLDVAGHSNNPSVREVLANGLVQAKRLPEAIEIYKTLPPEKLSNFSDEMFAQGNYDLALRGYTDVAERIPDQIRAAEVRVRIASIHMARKEYKEAERFLLQVHDDSSLQNSKVMFKTRVNQTACELLARLALIQGKDDQTVMQYLNEAKKFAYNDAERRQAGLQAVQFLLMRERYAEAKLTLDALLNGVQKGSAVEASGYFQSFLYYTLQDSVKADTMLTEMVIRKPEGPEMNDAIQLNMLCSALNGEAKILFLKAYREYQLYQTRAAITDLDSVFAKSKNEESLLLAADWSLDRGETEWARQRYAHEYTEPDLKAFALYQLARLEDDAKARDGLVIDYLTQNPGTVFSPSFRTLLKDRNQSVQ
jgi:tetratricopeptide (TPR) repeat protein